ncbi:MAG TPA: hypothetical protein VLJ37_00840 [bacterium]|nr:hypothetical protein [bacterium]
MDITPRPGTTAWRQAVRSGDVVNMPETGTRLSGTSAGERADLEQRARALVGESGPTRTAAHGTTVHGSATRANHR